MVKLVVSEFETCREIEHLLFAGSKWARRRKESKICIASNVKMKSTNRMCACK